MSQKDRMQMPQSTAGLIRYFEESKESIKIKPEYVVAAAGAIIAVEILLKVIF
jgi:preprotein translocase subunit Sec61beta